MVNMNDDYCIRMSNRIIEEPVWFVFWATIDKMINYLEERIAIREGKL